MRPVRQVMVVRPGYLKARDPVTGLMRKFHRLVAERHLGCLLSDVQVIHHRDSNPRNNALENLLVLPNQKYHMALEFHLRLQRRGMLPLFPDLLETREGHTPGSLWEAIQLGGGVAEQAKKLR